MDYHWRATAEAEREAAFQRYLELSQPYMDKITEDGDEHWHAGDLESRRELFMRRYTRPAPRADLTIPNTKRTA
jgi:hypothetical protein